jgi:ADP-heptose:LPS heptosyltransferase
MALDYPGGLGVKEMDYHAPIGELPHVFGTDIDSVPWSGPYIFADPQKAKKYNRHRIGIAWSAGIRREGAEGSWLARYGELKSLHFKNIEEIVMFDPSMFVSLQIGNGREECRFIDDVLPAEPTWADTAALIHNLDLVITPDTGLAHLAGAMGKKTWLMMHRHNSGWHFMCERPGASWNEASPWYPSMRIFRQRGNGWEDVVNAVCKALEQEKLREAA